jgi:endoglucanase
MTAMWLALTAVLAACAGRSSGPSATGRAADRAAKSFLTAYVRPDGRVSRRDQSGDTVSEGQAYGMLLAEVTGNNMMFDRIWRWTRVHMQLPTGLFAYHADAKGHLLSPNPASDADLLIAWALLRYQGPHADEHHQAGRQVAAALLAHETIDGPGGRPVITAGPWADGRPASLDPSYWALPALDGLAEMTGDSKWRLLASQALMLTRRLTRDGRDLPPDWALLGADGRLAPTPGPTASEPHPTYGLDAQRVPIWFAVSCDPQARALAAHWWALLRRHGRARALALGLNGHILDPAGAPLPLVAAAAAARAAGHVHASRRLMRRAAAEQHRFPTYYGGAWVALGQALLSGALGNTC